MIADDWAIEKLTSEHSKLLKAFRDEEKSMATSIKKSGGISGHNLTNAEFHRQNLTACRVIFGFKSFSEMKTRLACMFKEFRGPLNTMPGKNGRFREGEGYWGQMFPERNLM